MRLVVSLLALLPWAMSLIYSGKSIDVEGLTIVDFVQDSSLRLSRPWNLRRRNARELAEIAAIVLHTTHGWPDHKHPAPQRVNERGSTAHENTARDTIADWRKGGRFAGAHLVLDANGTVYCCADLETEAAYHAPPINGRSIGIEVIQQRDASIHRAQLSALPLLVGALSDRFKITRRMAYPYRNGPRHDSVTGSGVFGHRDVTDDRGAGDPGDFIPQALIAAGWTAF